MLRYLIQALLLLCCLPAAAQEFAPQDLDRVAAVVNKEVITWLELYKAMGLELDRGAAPMADKEKLKVFKDNEASFLEEMINAKLQLQEARRFGIGAGDREVESAINNIRKSYSMNADEFAKAVEKEGFTLEEYRKRLSDEIIFSKVIDREVRSKVTVTEEEINRYLEEIGRRQGETYRIRQIFLRDGGDVKERTGEVLERLRAGEDFQALAAEYSDDPSGKRGGDLGSVTLDDLAPEFQEALRTLKPGEVSAPFKTAPGTHIIKLEELKRSAYDEEARKALLEKKFPEEYKRWLKHLRGKSFVEIRL
ncbi:MAG: peptidylprolyl isomerase [Thermodesulfovibrionales bacterium]|nr:peptidylprolyl isomerase [Thermodesulfovibrionales bacterium]